MNSTSIPIDNINICFVGGVSTGKSTVLNSIFCEKLTQCKIKRTTMVPTVYVENAKGQTDPSEIYRIIEEKNKEIIAATELGQKLDANAYSELAFNVGKLDINILGDTGAFVNVYDVPGLNDARTQDIYYNYLETNFHKFNLIVFLVDIHSGLNTADEMRMLKFIAQNTRHHNQCSPHSREIHTLVVVNKADDMQDHDSKMEITGELSEMFTQTETTVRHEFRECGLERNLIGVIPLCAIDAYLYRMIKKHGTAFELSPEHVLKIGVNENGKKFSTKKPEVQRAEVAEILKKTDFIDTMIKLSGFKGFTDALHKFLNANDKGRQIRVDNLQYEMDKLDPVSDIKISKLKKLVAQYIILFDKMELIDSAKTHKKIKKFVTDLTSILNFRIECWTGTKCNEEDLLVQFYDNFIQQIFVPRFSEYYDTTKYSETLKHHVLTMVCEACSKTLSVQTIVDKLLTLKHTSMFDKLTIETVFAIIVANVREKDAVDFSESTNSQIQQLMSLFDECRALDVNLSQMLRFLIINQLYSESFAHDSLYVKQMLYLQSGELIISNYIRTAFAVNPSLATIVKGLPKDMVLTGLDQYYTQYEKYNGHWNFTR